MQNTLFFNFITSVILIFTIYPFPGATSPLPLPPLTKRSIPISIPTHFSWPTETTTVVSEPPIATDTILETHIPKYPNDWTCRTVCKAFGQRVKVRDIKLGQESMITVEGVSTTFPSMTKTNFVLPTSTQTEVWGGMELCNCEHAQHPVTDHCDHTAQHSNDNKCDPSKLSIPTGINPTTTNFLAPQHQGTNPVSIATLVISLCILLVLLLLVACACATTLRTLGIFSTAGSRNKSSGSDVHNHISL